LIRVAITSDRVDKAAPLYRGAGLDPVWLPCIKVEPARDDVLARAREAAFDADIILLSSARTVDLLWPHEPIPSVDVVAVGVATAAAVTRRGGRLIISGDSGLAGLASQAGTELGAAARVVFPRSAHSDPATLRSIRDLAPGLTEFEVYRTQPIAPEKSEVRAIAFSSPSAVEGWHLTRNLDGLVVGVIGATTLAAAARYRHPDVVASVPSHRVLAQALASHLEVKV
jgi:uroporphyrinogen-III synthase